ncbi:MAG: tetratricopeptide repeat protein [Acidobacteria bacterium]|nr:tetratricopeptide repeat protein [Acidobacteriota bacterium]
MKTLFNIARISLLRIEKSFRRTLGSALPARMRLAVAMLMLAAAVLPPDSLALGTSVTADPLEFRGQVVIPPQAVLRGKQIILTLQQVGTTFSARTRADTKGRFRFKKIPSGTYSISILIPGAGEMRSTVDVTHAFADDKGRVEIQFTYDEEALAHQALPVQQGLVSVRALSISRRARSEYAAARNDLRRQKIDSARRHLEKVVEIAPQFLEALNYLGILAFQRRDYAAAEDYFRKALEQDPESYEPLVNLGGALLALGQVEEAVEVNRRAQAAQPKDALANAQLGLSHYLLGNDKEALNYLLLTEELDPAHFTNPQIPLAKIYLRNSDKQSAIEELEDFLNHHPDSPEADSVRAMMQKIRQESESETAATTLYD